MAKVVGVLYRRAVQDIVLLMHRGFVGGIEGVGQFLPFFATAAHYSDVLDAQGAGPEEAYCNTRLEVDD